MGRYVRGHVWRHACWHIRSVLGVVDGWLWDEGQAVHCWRLGSTSRADRLPDHIRAHSPNIIPRRRPGTHLGLRGMPSGTIHGMSAEHAIRNRG